MIHYVTAIGTDCGKTVVSAILARALGSDYWKPIQTGSDRDSQTVERLTSGQVNILPEGLWLRDPLSPHAAAENEGRRISLSELTWPKSQNLVVEGAGGLLVPLNETETMADLFAQRPGRAVLVVRHYLGCINHTLLTLSELERRGVPLAGLVFNGPPTPQSEAVILAKTKASVLLRLPWLQTLTPTALEHYAEELRANLTE